MISDERLKELILMSEETVNTLPDGCEVHLIMVNERDELDALYELLDARQKIAKLIDLFDKTADHHCSGMCGHDDVLKKKGILTHDEWVKYADEVMREVENANKN